MFEDENLGMLNAQMSVDSYRDVTEGEGVYPISHLDYIDEFQSERENLVESVAAVIDAYFPIDDGGYRPIVQFGSMESNDIDRILGAFNYDAEATLQLLAGVTGVAIKTAQRRVGVSGLHDIADLEGLAHKNERVKKAARFYLSHLDVSLPLSAVLQTVEFRWTVEYRRVYRQDFESKVLSELEARGIPVVSGDSYPCRPDIAVPDLNDDLVVVGEIRKIGAGKLHTRFSEFESEVITLGRRYPDASIVLIFDSFEDLEVDDYQKYIDGLYDALPDDNNLADVYHFSQIDAIASEIRAGCSFVQSTLGECYE